MPSAVKSFFSSLWQRLRGTYGVDLTLRPGPHRVPASRGTPSWEGRFPRPAGHGELGNSLFGILVLPPG